MFGSCLRGPCEVVSVRCLSVSLTEFSRNREGVVNMRSLVKVMNLISQFKSDENGASLIEYTVLLAILLVAVIAIIAGVGKWISSEWASLSTAI